MTDLIIVGTDGSETAGTAVAEAADLAANLASKLLIVSAYPRVVTARLGEQAHHMPAPREWRTDPQPGPAAGAREILDAAVASLGRTDVAVDTAAREGEPAEAIIEVAEELGADLVVVGSKGMDSAKRFLLGSVPSRVAHHAPCSVLIVRTT